MKIKWTTIDSFKGNYSEDKLTIHRSCPLCGSWSAKTISDINNFQFYTDSASIPKRLRITQNQCLHCSALFMNPVYTQYGFKILFKESSASYGAPHWKYESRVNWLKKHIDFSSQSKIIDLGCHFGKLLSMLPSGLKKIGIEVDQQVVKQAKHLHPDIDFYCCDLSKLQINEKADVLTMFHVLEHLPNPATVLQKLHTIAHNKTVLALEVPVLENGFTKDINGYFSVHHLTHFSIASLRRCLNIAGWREISCNPGSTQEGCRILAVPNTNKEVCEIDNVANRHDIKLLYRYLSAYYNNLADLHCQIEKIKLKKICVIWGGGNHTELLYHLSPLFRLSPDIEYLIVDSDTTKWNHTWRGISILSPEVLLGINWEECHLVISSYGGQESILKEALKLGVPNSRMLKLY